MASPTQEMGDKGGTMIVLDFDSEGTTYCPKNEKATKDDCHACKYLKMVYLRYADKPVGLGCIYRNVYPEEGEYATVSGL